tara:strand:- start:33 stop:518 length:486 start_codon:yes stop_codon:yes gene_type:complete
MSKTIYRVTGPNGADFKVVDDLGTTEVYAGSALVSSSNASTSVTAGVTLDAADSGKTVFLADAASGNVTLPAVTTTGWKVRVQCAFAITTSSAVLSAEGDNITGTLVVNGATVLAEAEDQINFILNLAEIGDYVDFVSDGSKWIVNGIGGAGGSITATDPS